MNPVADAWKDVPFPKDLDGCPICRRDSCDDAAHLAPPSETKDLPDSTVGDFIPAEEIAKAPPAEHIVEDIILRNSVTVLVAESGKGKSFLATSLASAVSADTEWFGRDVIHGSVAYILYEADALPIRVQALQEQGCDVSNIYFLRAADPISPAIGRDGTETPSIGEDIIRDRLQRLAKRLEAEGKPPLVKLIIDTIRTSISGSEDNSGDVSAYLRAVRRILATLPGAGALLLHHSGWQDGEQKRKRERGSSAFRGNVDVTLFLGVTDDSDPAAVHLELKTLKIRDSKEYAPLRLIRREVDLPAFNRFGKPLTSCVIEQNPKTYREIMDEREAAEAEAEKQAAETLQNNILALIGDNEQLTSQGQIREMLNVKQSKVSAAIAQLLQRKLLVPKKQRAVFQLTDEGKRAAILCKN